MGKIDKNIIRLKEFNSLDLQRVQSETIELTSTKTDELLEKYKTFAESHNGRYINSDLMKMVFEIYAKSQENRGKYNLAVSNSAACLTNELYIRAIKDEDVKRCIYVAGPYGAGKSFFIQSLFLAGVIPDNTLVYEGSITAPAFGKKVELAIQNNIEPEMIILNPTLELSLNNIRQRMTETGRDVIKSEVIEKYADMYSNMEKLFSYLNDSFPKLQTKQYPISFQIYNKSSNVPEDLSISYDLNDLQHGTRQEISKKYDLINKQLCTDVLKDDEKSI